jgi:hypothetical protein
LFGEYEPAGQFWHAEPSGEKLPAAHGVQVAPEPTEAAAVNSVPLEQPEHEHEPLLAIKPDGQSWHRPPCTENLSTPQSVHELEANGDDWPHGHNVQRVAPALENEPAAQAWQAEPSAEK